MWIAHRMWISVRISFIRWPIHIINPVDETKLSCKTDTDRQRDVQVLECRVNVTPHERKVQILNLKYWVIGYLNLYVIQQITSRREKANEMQQIEREQLERER